MLEGKSPHLDNTEKAETRNFRLVSLLLQMDHQTDGGEHLEMRSQEPEKAS